LWKYGIKIFIAIYKGEDIDFAELAEDVMGNINDDDNGIS
jgi:hypothetical protein